MDLLEIGSEHFHITLLLGDQLVLDLLSQSTANTPDVLERKLLD
jgi:hypothetical protein